jgi:hypothetical protein
MGLIMKKFFEVDSIYKVKKNIKDVLEWSNTFIPGEEVTYYGYTIDKDQGNYIYRFLDSKRQSKSVIENPDGPPFPSSSYQDYFEKIGVSSIPVGIYVSGDLGPFSKEEE